MFSMWEFFLEPEVVSFESPKMGHFFAKFYEFKCPFLRKLSIKFIKTIKIAKSRLSKYKKGKKKKNITRMRSDNTLF